MSDHTYRAPAPTKTKTAAAADSGPSSQTAPQGNAAKAEMIAAKKGKEEKLEEPGWLDKIGVVMGSEHLKTMLGETGRGVKWDDKEKGANRMEVDIWGKDEVRIPKLRIAEIAKQGLSATDVHGDGIKLREGDASAAGNYTADLSVPEIGAKNLNSTAPALAASALNLQGVKVHRELNQKEGELTDFFAKAGKTTIQVESASLNGLRTPDIRADHLAAKNVVGIGDGTNNQLAIGGASALGVSAGGAHINAASAGKISAQMGPKGGHYGIESLDASGIQAGTGESALSLGGASARGLSADTNIDGGGSASAQRIVGADLSAGGVRAKTVGVDGLSGTLTRGPKGAQTTAKASGATVSGLSAGGVKVDGVGAKGLTARHAADGTAGTAQSLTATGVKGPEFGMTGAQAQNVEASLVGGVTTLGAGRMDAQKLNAYGASASAVSMDGAKGTSGPSGTSVAAKKLGAKDIAVAGGGAKDASATNVTASFGETQRLAAATMEANGVTAGEGSASRIGVTGATAAIGPKGTKIAAKGASASNLKAGGATVNGATASGIDVGIADGTTSIAAGKAEVNGVHTPSVDLDGVVVTGAKGSTGPSGSAASAKSAKVTGFAAGSGDTRTTIANATAADMSVKNAGGVTNIGAGSADATGVQAGKLQAASIGVTGGKGSFGPDGAQLSASTANARGVVDGGLSLATANASGLTAGVANGTTTLGVASGSASGLKSPGVRADTMSLSGGSAKLSATSKTLGASRVGGTGLSLGENTVESAQATDANMTMDGTGVSGTAGSLTGTGMRSGSTSLNGAAASRAAFKTAGGVTTASADQLTAKGLTSDVINMGTGTANNAKVRAQGGTTDIAASSARVTDFNTGDVFGAGSIDATNLTAQGTMGTGGLRTSIAADQAKGTGVAVDAGGVKTKVGKISTGKIRVGTGQEPAAERTTKPLMQQAAALIDDASVSAQAPMNAQTMGSGMSKMTVKPNTTAYVEVKIVDGQVVPAGTSARFSKPLDTWAWTSVSGVYLNDKGKMFADVSGMFDPNISEEANKAMGVTGKKSVPLSVNALAAGLSPTPAVAAPVAANPVTTAPTSAKATTAKASPTAAPVAAASTAKAAPTKASNTKGTKATKAAPVAAPPIMDPNDISLQGTVGLNAGSIDAGVVQATLGQGNVGTVDRTVGPDGQRSMSVNFAKLVLDALGVEAGSVNVDIKGVKAEGAGVTVGGR